MTVVLVQTTIPHYRAAIVSGLRSQFGTGFSTLAGVRDFDPTVELGMSGHGLVVIRNLYLVRRRLLWQRSCVLPLLRPAVAILDLNPRILSSWAILAVRRLLGKPTLLWGHAWPRAGASARTDRIRQVMRRLASGVVVYTDTEARELRRRMPGAHVMAAPNGLYTRSATVVGTDTRPARTVLFVGRLVEAKKPDLLLDAFLSALDRLPHDTRLVFVGDGDRRAALEQRARASGHGHRVEFTGSITEFEDLQRLYWEAMVTVSPGYAGLSLIQSLWFGVPMIIARDEPHAPEIEAARDGVNVVYVASDSTESLGAAIVSIFHAKAEWMTRGPEITRACTERYAVEATVDALADAVRAELS